MHRTDIPRPQADEFAPYYGRYIEQASGGDGLIPLLARQGAALRAACTGLSEDEALHRYAEGKWSVKEVLGHVNDAERIFAYRVLRIARGDTTPLASFDENPYVAAAGSDRRPLAELLDEFDTIRAATLSLLRSLGPAELERRGTASDNPVSVRALAHIIAGHAEHHLGILRERYL